MLNFFRLYCGYVLTVQQELFQLRFDEFRLLANQVQQIKSFVNLSLIAKGS
jgi:hypothetical protein